MGNRFEEETSSDLTDGPAWRIIPFAVNCDENWPADSRVLSLFLLLADAPRPRGKPRTIPEHAAPLRGASASQDESRRMPKPITIL